MNKQLQNSRQETRNVYKKLEQVEQLLLLQSQARELDLVDQLRRQDSSPFGRGGGTGGGGGPPGSQDRDIKPGSARSEEKPSNQSRVSDQPESSRTDDPAQEPGEKKKHKRNRQDKTEADRSRADDSVSEGRRRLTKRDSTIKSGSSLGGIGLAGTQSRRMSTDPSTRQTRGFLEPVDLPVTVIAGQSGPVQPGDPEGGADMDSILSKGTKGGTRRRKDPDKIKLIGSGDEDESIA